ncbi:hypothetical protein K457DRAFT_1818855 [Linnemannia elongata AG-77]|uniref:Uncharacterized protein n=1 Tax=Linnemannia elongata AG-77 TaxID=1314771 RepID=A0A197K136_9FUNG|nr:hypothetical protein K457DRAFT_1818855 [Linnemannia elongata AG-77]
MAIPDQEYKVISYASHIHQTTCPSPQSARARSSGTFGRVVSGHTQSISRISTSPSENRILSGSVDRTIQVWNMSACDLRVPVSIDHKALAKISYYLGVSYEFATGCQDGSIRVWRVQTGSRSVSVQLVWSTGLDFLVTTGAAIVDTTGLSDANRILLLQRGATNGSSLEEA